MASFSFRRVQLTLEAPSTWRKGPFLKRMLYPYQPELFGPNNEYIGFDNVARIARIPTLGEADRHLQDEICARGSRIVATSVLAVGDKEHATAIFDKPMALEPGEVTRMKKYYIVLGDVAYTITANLSFEGSRSSGRESTPYRRGDRLTSFSRKTLFYSEDGYDRIVQSIKSRL